MTHCSSVPCSKFRWGCFQTCLKVKSSMKVPRSSGNSTYSRILLDFLHFHDDKCPFHMAPLFWLSILVSLKWKLPYSIANQYATFCSCWLGSYVWKSFGWAVMDFLCSFDCASIMNFPFGETPFCLVLTLPFPLSFEATTSTQSFG